MLVKKTEIYWDAVQAADLAGYKVYWGPVGSQHDYTGAAITVPDSQLSVVAPDAFPAGAFEPEGEYNVWVTAVDSQGNESSPLALSSRFDFTPPSAPLSGGFRQL
jgi:hypothetical protein